MAHNQDKCPEFVQEILEKHRENLGKLFIGGLNKTVTDEDIRDVFSPYGNVTDCVAIKNKEDPAGGNKGFGFVTFDSVESVNEVMDVFNSPAGIEIRGKRVDIKRAIPKDVQDPQAAHSRTKKCFVGGISHNLSAEDLKEYFEAFPNVKVEKLDFKGKFAFVEFLSENDADLLSIISKHTPAKQGTRPFEVKKAEGDSGRGGRGGRSFDGGSRGGGFRGGRGGGGYQGGRGGFGGGRGYGGGGGGYGGGSYGATPEVGFGSGSYDSGFAYDSFGAPPAVGSASSYGASSFDSSAYGGAYGGGAASAYGGSALGGFGDAGYAQGYGGSGSSLGSYGQESSSFGPTRGGGRGGIGGFGGGRGLAAGARGGRTRPY